MTVAVDPVAAAERQIVAEHQLREKIVNEEFKIWKKTVPLLYDTIHTHVLDTPLLSVQFLPSYTVSDNKNKISVRLVVGTNTSGRDTDYLRLVQLELPSTLAPDFASFAVGDSIPIPMNGDGTDLFSILNSWKHPGEVNKLKVSPLGDKVVTFDNQGTVHLYNLKDETPVDYAFHSAEGYALDWVSETEFLSGANDSKIALWDVANTTAPVKQFNSHSAVINDLSYSAAAKVLFGSVADDFSTQIHDIRAPEESPVIKINNSHIQNSIAFHPLLSSLFATGGKDNVVNLYDARNTREPIRKLFGHNDSVVGLMWDKSADPTYLYSWGLDKRVITWDLSKLSEEVTYPTSDASESKRRTRVFEDPCFAFVHGGHTNRINDVSVHAQIQNLFASAGDDNLLEIYKPKTLLDDTEEEEADEEEEEEEQEEAKEETKEEPKEEQDEESKEEADEQQDVDMKE